jgi:hypothetical protein
MTIFENRTETLREETPGVKVIRRLVAQVFSLLYRRFAIGTSLKRRKAAGTLPRAVEFNSAIRQIEKSALRLKRPEGCAPKKENAARCPPAKTKGKL